MFGAIPETDPSTPLALGSFRSLVEAVPMLFELELPELPPPPLTPPPVDAAPIPAAEVPDEPKVKVPESAEAVCIDFWGVTKAADEPESFKEAMVAEEVVADEQDDEVDESHALAIAEGDGVGVGDGEELSPPDCGGEIGGICGRLDAWVQSFPPAVTPVIWPACALSGGT